VDRLLGPGFRLEGLHWVLDLSARTGPSLQGRARRLVVDALKRPLKGIGFRCTHLTLEAGRAACPDLRLTLAHPGLDRRASRWAWDWRAAGRRLRVTLKRLGLGGGDWSGRLLWAAGAWQAALRAEGLRGEALTRLLEPLLQGATLAGRLDLKAEARGRERTWRRLDLQATAEGLGFSSADAAWLAQGLDGGAALHLRPDIEGRLDIGLKAGEVLTPFFYLSPGKAAVHLGADIHRRPEGLSLEGIRYRDPGRLSFSGGLRLGAHGEVQGLDLRVPRTPAQPLYRGCFQPLLGETLLQSVAWEGDFALQARRRGKATELRLRLFDLGIEDRPDPAANPKAVSRFGLHGLDGELAWSDTGPPRPGRLRWRGGHLLKALVLGAAEARFELGPRGGRLLAPLNLPVLDGALLLDRLRWGREEKGALGFDLDAVLTPVSLERLSAALDWPELAGTLSGVIPGVTYRDGRLEVRGKLLIRVFGGEVVVEHLRLAQVFGPLPVLEADVRLRGLDLEVLTRTFAFGRITGRLDGEIRGLRLEGWRPVAFDARFATPADDPGPHLINQRAVDNLTALSGGGAATGLSRTFLRMFEVFHYGRLGLSCRLQGGVCHLGGVEEAKNGYYLVTPAGLPRIDVRGYNRRADWSRLLDQLGRITQTGAPRVEVGTGAAH